ncbi:MAG: class A beta-lactamase-related serine hydrolase [Anaerolineales bacterium]|nr:class A beta-lactamase-related serine hydrolase [Anaerolineales bacterium]
MKRNDINLQRWVSIALLLTSVALFFYQLVAFSRQRSHLPLALTIAGIHVGGLVQPEALERLLQIYSYPIELYYDDTLILLNPANVGFRLDTDVMLAAAELERTGTPFWDGFWDFLWTRSGEPQSVPLKAEFSVTQLEEFLRDIAARYDEPPILAQPRPGTPFFTSGTPGRVLDIARAEELIGAVLQSPTSRSVNLPVVSNVVPRPTLETLEILLKQNIEVDEFNGLAVIYVTDLRTGENFHFATLDGADINVEPDIAFSAASIIKISIMTALFRYEDEPLDPETERWLVEMITESGNDPSDWIMQQIETFNDAGPILVTETIQDLGLENTFIAGYYFLGAPRLNLYRTPANQRLDIDTHPDSYTQTTASDMSLLLGDIYACAEGGGTLLAVFPDEITPQECSRMLVLLSENILGTLIKAGVPEGTRVAHKHGWRSSPLDMIGDAGIVFSPGGDYVLTIFLWNETEMVWEPTSKLIANLSRATYNYFNPPID